MKTTYLIKTLTKFLYSNKFLFLIIALPFKLFDFLFIRQKNEILFYGYKGRYTGNSASLYRYCLSNKQKLDPIWLLDRKDISNFDNVKKYFLIPDKNSNAFQHLKFLMKIASAKVLVVSLVGDLRFYSSLLYSKKRLEVLLPHGVTIKSGGIMSKHLNTKEKRSWANNSKRFDIISVSSRIEQSRVSASLNVNPEKIKILGVQRGEYSKDTLTKDKEFNHFSHTIMTKLDMNMKSENFLKATKVLYAPTHRDHLQGHYKFTLLEKIDGFNIGELNSFLEEENIILFLREHAESKIKSTIKNRKLENNIFDFSIEDFPDLEKYLNLFDVIITDYSGIFLEHLMTDKSLAFALFDYDEYERNRGLILPKDVLFPGFTFQSQKKLIYYLKNRAVIDKSYVNNRKYLHSLLFEKGPKDACKRTIEEINKLI